MANASIGEALYREITGGRSPRTEVHSVGGAIEHFMARAGGVASRAARLAGVPASTFRAWTRGRQPKNPGDIVERASRSDRRARLRPGREARLRGSSMTGITLNATYDYDGRPRDVAIGGYLDYITLADDLVDAYLAGDSLHELGEMFAMHVDDTGSSGFYTRTFAAEDWTVHSLDGWG